MAFDITKLELMAQSPSRTLWSYSTTDSAATVDTAGYFNSAYKHLKVGDIIYASVATGGTRLEGIFAVNANSGGVVDVADLTTLVAADTD